MKKRTGQEHLNDSYNPQSETTSNALILPSTSSNKNKKSAGKKFDARGRLKLKSEKHRKTSKKKQKIAQKLAERKLNRKNRAEILEELSKFQLETDLLKNMCSVAKMQQKSSKKQKLNSIAGSNKKRPNSDSAITPSEAKSPKIWQTTPYFETDSSSSDSELDENPTESKPDLTESSETVPSPKVELSDEIDPKNEEFAEKTMVLPLNLGDQSSETVDIPNREPAVNVPVFRDKLLQQERMELPILAEEQSIVEAVRENSIVIICGETGSGKTTQVPQFLYEAGFTRQGRQIGITEPRRVAAISMSQRVAKEMNLSHNLVSYQIRFEGNTTKETEIKFMTDGVLLKELQTDIRLSKYSVIIIDEAHERSMYSDILIGLLSRIGPMRARDGDPLKLVIMSATLRTEDFTQQHLFRQEPKLLKVDSRQYPVTIYFNRKTPGQKYLTEAYKKIRRIHEKLPEGGILVFVSGQREVQTLIKWLKKTYPTEKTRGRSEKPELSEKERRKLEKKQKKLAKKNALKATSLDLDSYKIQEFSSDDKASQLLTKGSGPNRLDLDEIGAADDLELFEDDADWLDPCIDQSELAENCEPLYCLPLYSLLPTQKQAKVFLPPPAGCRLCVVATNVAETSLTIPNVKYVVDTGKEKRRLYDPVTGVSKFVIGWTSKASANQRAGRAGRTGPGHCYRLFSSAVFSNSFDEFSTPDIIDKPVDELILQMKSMNIVKVKNFPFPTPPEKDALEAGERRLLTLGALELGTKPGQTQEEARISKLGKTIALFPVKPEYGKILALANQRGLLPYAVCLVAALSVREPMVNFTSFESGDSRERMLKYLRIRRQWAGKGENLLLGDLSTLLRAVGAAEYEGLSEEFCEENGLRYMAMAEIRKLRKQLTNLINSACDLGANQLTLDAKMTPPTGEQCKLLRQIVLAGLAGKVAKKCGASESIEKGAYLAEGIEGAVFIHPTSVLFRQEPEWVVYQEIIDGAKKKYMQTVCAIQPDWLAIFAEKYCTFGKRIEGSEPFYCKKKDEIREKVTATFGLRAWKLPDVERTCNMDLNWYKWLAIEFLEGNVFRKVKKFREKMLAPPRTIVKSWAHLQPRTKGILNALVANGRKNRKDIEREFIENPDFLLSQYCDWIPEKCQDEVRAVWPPI